MKPIVSVITTVFNCERFILESLISISKQSFKDFEWIIVNDGCTDHTWDIISDFKHPNIKLIDNDSNKRIPIRRNEAINMALGEYIAIHDGDDISLPGRIESQVNFLQSNPDVFCLGGWAIRIDENGQDHGIMSYPPSDGKDIVKMMLHRGRNPIIDPTCMFRRDIFLLLGGYTLEKTIYTVPDMDLWSRGILEGYNFANLKECLIKYRVNPDGMTRKYNSEMIIAHKIVLQRFRHQFSKSGMPKG